MIKHLTVPKLASFLLIAAFHVGQASPAVAQLEDEDLEGTGALRADVVTMVPVGRASELLGVGVGALVGADYSILSEQLTLVVRGGYVRYLEKQQPNGNSLSASDITLWAGAKWRLYKGLHVQGDLIASWHTKTTTYEDKTQFNSAGPTGRANAGFGYEVGVFDFGALFSVGMEAPKSHLAALFTAGIRLPIF